MKAKLLGMTALAAIAWVPPAALAADQASATPAGAERSAKPSIEEELVYLRDIIALQTLRLDEAEQALARQTKLLDDQQKKIAVLEKALNGALASAGATGTSLASAPAGDYTVRSGDTLGGVAKKFDVPLSELAAANKLKSPYNLRVGQRLSVPGTAPAAPAAQTAVASAEQARPEPVKVAAAQDPPGPSPESRPEVTDRAVKQERKDKPAETTSGGPQEVGVRPANEDDRPEVAVLTDVGGILTPKGALYAEPSFDYTVTSDNRFFFQGVEIVDAILIGVIEATDSNRRARTEGLGLRYGITNRLEADARVTWVNRNDRISGVAIDDSSSFFRELNGSGLGDAEVGLHYQLTNGKGFPFTVLNMRAKAPTGTGPFDVERSAASGVELELPSGSGFWTLEPSVTFILPADPAVIFANLGYQANLSTSPDAALGNVFVREVSPGDAVRASVGIGLAVNDRFSMSFGYDQSSFFATKTRLELADDPGVFVTSSQQPAMVGSFLFGGSYTVNDRIRLNLNTAFGATDEAPDMRISLRAQIRLFD
jgi:LysM repeat protein